MSPQLVRRRADVAASLWRRKGGKRDAVDLPLTGAVPADPPPPAGGPSGLYTGTLPTDVLSWGPDPDFGANGIVERTAARQNIITAAGDYVLKLPTTGPLEVGSTFLIEIAATVTGRVRVRVVGGRIHLTSPSTAPFLINVLGNPNGRNLVVRVDVEGVVLSGVLNSDGLRIDARGAYDCVVTLQNIDIEYLTGTEAGAHADDVQAWAGPGVLRMDRVKGISNYQGLILHPRQFPSDGSAFYSHPEEFGRWELRNLWLHMATNPETGKTGTPIMSWHDVSGAPFIDYANVWVTWETDEPSPSQAKHGDTIIPDLWDGLIMGTPPPGGTVFLGTPGVGYVSPGYATDGGPLALPTASTTGVQPSPPAPARTSVPTSYITANGTPIKDRHFTGNLTVEGTGRADLSNVKVNGELIIRTTGGGLSEDLEVGGWSISSSQGITLRRVKSLGGIGKDAGHITSDSGSRCADILVEDWFADNDVAGWLGSSQNHHDLLQVRGVNGLTVRRWLGRQRGFSSVYNAALYLEEDVETNGVHAQNEGITVEDFELEGGGFNVLQLKGDRIVLRRGILHPAEAGSSLVLAGGHPFTATGIVSPTGTPLTLGA